MLPCPTGPTLVAHGSDTRQNVKLQPFGIVIIIVCLYSHSRFSPTRVFLVLFYLFFIRAIVYLCALIIFFFRSVAPTHVATTLN